MKTLYTFLFVFLALFMQDVEAQVTMRDCWLNMPQSEYQYLTLVERSEMLRHYEEQDTAVVENRLSEQSRIDTLTTNYCRVILNKRTTLEMKLFAKDDGSQNICVVKTFSLPQLNSIVAIYNTDWKKQTSVFDESFSIEDFIDGKNVVSEEDLEKLKMAYFPYLFNACLALEKDIITITPVVSYKEYLNDDISNLVKELIKEL